MPNFQNIKENLYNQKYEILQYFGIFLILFAHSKIINIGDNSLIKYFVDYGILLIIVSLAIYFYATNNISNYLKLSLLVPFINNLFLVYAFIILTLFLFNKKLLLPFKSPLMPIYLLLGWAAISYIINQFIEINIVSFPFFTFTFFIPFLFLSLFYKFSKDYYNDVLKFLLNVVLILVVIIVIQTFFYWTRSPDLRHGGTISAHFASFILAFLFLNIIFKRNNLTFPYKEKIICILALPLIFLLDGKYVLLFLVISLATTFIFFVVKKYKYKFLIILSLLLMLIGWYNLTDRYLYFSALAVKTEAFQYESLKELFTKYSAKYSLIKDALNTPINDPNIFIIGSGPGTFLSRAANSLSYSNKYVDRHQKKFALKKKLINTFGDKTSWAKEKYGYYYFDESKMRGSLFIFGSSFINIFYELGIIGLFLFLFFFIWQFIMIRQLRFNYSFIAITFLIVLMSFPAQWYEIAYFQIFTFSMFGLLISNNKKIVKVNTS